MRRRRRNRLLVSKVCRIDRCRNLRRWRERAGIPTYLKCTYPLESYATFLFFILYMAPAHLRVMGSPQCMPYKSAAKVTLISPNILVRGIAFLFRSKNHIYIYMYIN